MPFLGLFIAVVCLFTFFRKRSNRSQENVTDRFWKRESIANNTRLQDLSGRSEEHTSELQSHA